MMPIIGRRHGSFFEGGMAVKCHRLSESAVTDAALPTQSMIFSVARTGCARKFAILDYDDGANPWMEPDVPFPFRLFLLSGHGFSDGRWFSTHGTRRFYFHPFRTVKTVVKSLV